MNQYESTYLAYGFTFAMRHIVYKFDLESSISAKSLRPIMNIRRKGYADGEDYIYKSMHTAITKWYKNEKNPNPGSLQYAYQVLFRNLVHRYVDKNPKKDIRSRHTRVMIPLSKDAYRPPSSIVDYLASQGVTIVNYLAGIGNMRVKTQQGEKDRQVSLGRILAKDPNLKKLYDNDPGRQGVHKAKVGDVVDRFLILSRHPFDILGISTDKGWHSCLHIHGINRHYLPEMISSGVLAIYLVESRIEKEGEEPVSKAIARNLIYPAMFIAKPVGKILKIKAQDMGKVPEGYTDGQDLSASDAALIKNLVSSGYITGDDKPNTSEDQVTTPKHQNETRAKGTYLYLPENEYRIPGGKGFPHDFRKKMTQALYIFFNKKNAIDGVYVKLKNLHYDEFTPNEDQTFELDLVNRLISKRKSLFSVIDGKAQELTEPRFISNGYIVLSKTITSYLDDIDKTSLHRLRLDYLLSKGEAKHTNESGQLKIKVPISAIDDDLPKDLLHTLLTRKRELLPVLGTEYAYTLTNNGDYLTGRFDDVPHYIGSLFDPINYGDRSSGKNVSDEDLANLADKLYVSYTDVTLDNLAKNYIEPEMDTFRRIILDSDKHLVDRETWNDPRMNEAMEFLATQQIFSIFAIEHSASGTIYRSSMGMTYFNNVNVFGTSLQLREFFKRFHHLADMGSYFKYYYVPKDEMNTGLSEEIEIELADKLEEIQEKIKNTFSVVESIRSISPVDGYDNMKGFYHCLKLITLKATVTNALTGLAVPLKRSAQSLAQVKSKHTAEALDLANQIEKMAFDTVKELTDLVSSPLVRKYTLLAFPGLPLEEILDLSLNLQRAIYIANSVINEMANSDLYRGAGKGTINQAITDLKEAYKQILVVVKVTASHYKYEAKLMDTISINDADAVNARRLLLIPHEVQKIVALLAGKEDR